MAERAGKTWCCSWEMGWSFLSVFCPMLPDSGEMAVSVGCPLAPLWSAWGRMAGVQIRPAEDRQPGTEGTAECFFGKYCPSLSEWSQNWPSLRSGCGSVTGTTERDWACLCPSSSWAWLWSTLSHSGLSWVWHHLHWVSGRPTAQPEAPLAQRTGTVGAAYR